MHARAFPSFVVGYSGCRTLGVVLALAMAWCSQAHAQGAIEEFTIHYPRLQHTPSTCHAVNGSTHEITYDHQGAARCGSPDRITMPWCRSRWMAR
jgi:hypothetical protein